MVVGGDDESDSEAAAALRPELLLRFCVGKERKREEWGQKERMHNKHQHQHMIFARLRIFPFSQPLHVQTKGKKESSELTHTTEVSRMRSLAAEA